MSKFREFAGTIRRAAKAVDQFLFNGTRVLMCLVVLHFALTAMDLVFFGGLLLCFISAPLSLFIVTLVLWVFGKSIVSTFRKQYKRALLNLAIVICAVFLMINTNHYRWGVRLALFHAAYDVYETALQNAQAKDGYSGGLVVSWPIYGARTYIDESGQRVVECFTDGGFPVKHRGFIYLSDSNVTPQIQRRWPWIRQVNENWYVFMD